MIIYFTGTGNSRFVAERLAEYTGDIIIDSAEYLRKGETAAFTEPGPYIFVVPTYVSAPPLAFLEFIRGSIFPEETRVYFVMTAASSMSAGPIFCKKISDEKGFIYMGTGLVVMPQNYIVYFKMGTPEVNEEKLARAPEQIGKLARLIQAGETLPEKKIKRREYALVRSVLKPYYRLFISARKFKAGDECISCGECVRVCPLGNIRMAKGRPVWEDRCTHCMACINLCPAEAIEYGKGTRGKARYHGPESPGIKNREKPDEI